jgi:hypothetical protein
MQNTRVEGRPAKLKPHVGFRSGGGGSHTSPNLTQHTGTPADDSSVHQRVASHATAERRPTLTLTLTLTLTRSQHALPPLLWVGAHQ